MSDTEEYPIAIFTEDSELIDRAGNVETAVSVLYGDLSDHDGRPRIIQVPIDSVFDKDAERLAYEADINADCWGIPVDTIERVHA